MMERLNNDQVAQRIIDTNSNIQRYLNLAPSFKLASPQPKTTNTYYNKSVPHSMFPRPIFRP